LGGKGEKGLNNRKRKIFQKRGPEIPAVLGNPKDWWEGGTRTTGDPVKNAGGDVLLPPRERPNQEKGIDSR